MNMIKILGDTRGEEVGCPLKAESSKIIDRRSNIGVEALEVFTSMDCSIISRESPDDLSLSGTETALRKIYRISVNAPSQMLGWFHFTGCMDIKLPMRSALR